MPSSIAFIFIVSIIVAPVDRSVAREGAENSPRGLRLASVPEFDYSEAEHVLLAEEDGVELYKFQTAPYQFTDQTEATEHAGPPSHHRRHQPTRQRTTRLSSGQARSSGYAPGQFGGKLMFARGVWGRLVGVPNAGESTLPGDLGGPLFHLGRLNLDGGLP